MLIRKLTSTLVFFISLSRPCLGQGLADLFNDVNGDNSVFEFLSIESILPFIMNIEIEGAVKEWINIIDEQIDTPYEYFIGVGRPDHFGDLDARRFLVIIPSEFVRDETGEWDYFELLVAFDPEPNEDSSGILWLSTENYRMRNKRLRGSYMPSAEWEYFPLSTIDEENRRLAVIGDAIKRAAEQAGMQIATNP